jgi:hypothetical protein
MAKCKNFAQTSLSAAPSIILTIAFWWLTEEVTPDLIPHSEVKLFRGNDTHTVGKVARRQNRVVNMQTYRRCKSTDSIQEAKQKTIRKGGFFVIYMSLCSYVAIQL